MSDELKKIQKTSSKLGDALRGLRKAIKHTNELIIDSDGIYELKEYEIEELKTILEDIKIVNEKYKKIAF